MSVVRRVCVIGAGAWGTALAQCAARAGRDVVLWARHQDVADTINRDHENRALLAGVALDPAIAATTDLARAAIADLALLVVPAQATRELCGRLKPLLAPSVPVVICAKGIEAHSGLLLDRVVAEAMPGHRLALLSGPSFASEVARGLPTAVAIACADKALGADIAQALGSAAFRPYWNDDPTGVALGGAVKNVIAIACGIVEGAGLGSNARAALMTRGLAEIMRLGRALSAKPETLMGLAGLGDLALTCNSAQSRNMSLGIALGTGRSLAQALAGRRDVVEGVATAAAVLALAARHKVEMPISAAVDAIIHGRAELGQAIAALLARPLKAEDS